MNNEEIEGAVCETANKLMSIRTLPAEQVEAETEALLLDLARSLVSRSYEKATVEVAQMRKACLDYYGENFPEHLLRFLDARLDAIRDLK